MKYLKQKIELITPVIKNIDDYIAKLSSVISQGMSANLAKIKKNKEIISKELGEITETISDLRYMIHVEKIHHAITEINGTFSKMNSAKFLYSSNMSDTYKTETYNMYRTLSGKYRRLFTQIGVLDEKIIQEVGSKILEKIKTSPDRKEEFQSFRKIFHENQVIINLYKFVCVELIKYFKKEDRELLFKLLNMIEEDKNIVLKSNQVPAVKKIKKNPLLKSFGLIPNGGFLKPHEIAEKFFSQRVTTDVFKKLSKKHKVCIIILNKTTYLPTVSAIETLLDVSEVKKYFQPSEVGVSKNTVAKNSTIRFLEKGRGWNFSSEFFGSLDDEKFLILETFNGKIFRNLNFWINTNKYVLRKSRLINFIEYFKQYRSSKFYPSRCDYYNARLSGVILKNLYFPKKISVASLTEESTEIDARHLRQIISSQAVDIFKKKEKTVKNNVDLGILIKSDIFSDIFSSIIVKYYDRYSSQKLMRQHTFKKSAILVDFLYQLKELTKQFKKEIQTNFNEIELTPVSYKKSRTIFEEVLSKSLSVIIVDKKNLYQAMLFKDKLLSI